MTPSTLPTKAPRDFLNYLTIVSRDRTDDPDPDAFVRALGSKVLVAYEKPPTKSAGGAIDLMPRNAGFFAAALVLAVGPEAAKHLEPGARVLFGRTNAMPSGCKFFDVPPPADAWREKYAEIVFVDVDDVLCEIGPEDRLDA